MSSWWRFEQRAVLLRSEDIHDGDSLKVMITLGFGSFAKVRLRLFGIDTPELNDEDMGNRGNAKQARDRVRALVPAGVPLTIETHEYPGDKYGRWLCRLFLPDGRLLNDVLVEEGYAVAYDGGKKP
jgi:endonuclease YncB( thermonuclease family)